MWYLSSVRILRKKEVIGDRIASICKSHNVTVDYAFQDINDIPGELPAGRTKPWGTGQAVLAAKNVIKTPFIVINADDYYGKEGFKAVHEYLVNGGKSCMAGFVLKNTLSDNGGVTRGICKMDENGNLTEVVETKNIVKTAYTVCPQVCYIGLFLRQFKFHSVPKIFCQDTFQAECFLLR